MAKAIEGKNAILRLYKAGLFELMGCSTSVSFNCETELIRKTGPSSAGYVEFASRLCEWGISHSGVTFISRGNDYTVFDMLNEQLRREGVDMELEFTDDEDHFRIIKGHVLIPSITIDAPAVGFVEESIEFKGSGPFEILTNVIPPTNEDEVKKYEYIPGFEEDSFSDPVLIGREILHVVRDVATAQVITAGTPNEKQVKYLSGSGAIVAPETNKFQPGEYILVLYK